MKLFDMISKIDSLLILYMPNIFWNGYVLFSVDVFFFLKLIEFYLYHVNEVFTIIKLALFELNSNIIFITKFYFLLLK